MNLLSLLPGISAIVLAVRGVKVRGSLVSSTISGICCSASLLCQLMDNDRISQLEDIAAILDTAHARAVCAGVLLALCTALHIAALLRSRKKAKGNHC